jgi:hypothetical protein
MTDDIDEGIATAEVDEAIDLDGSGTEDRGTPHRPHIRAAWGLRPGGLRKAHTSHSHAANAESPLLTSIPDDEPLDRCIFAFEADDEESKAGRDR